MRNHASGSTSYSAEFTFKTDTGAVVTQKRQFPEELIADFQSGTPVKIVYDPKNPSEFVFEKERSSWLLVLVGLGFLVASPFLILRKAARG